MDRRVGQWSTACIHTDRLADDSGSGVGLKDELAVGTLDQLQGGGGGQLRRHQLRGRGQAELLGREAA